MLEPAHAAAHILRPSRRDLRYYEGVVNDYDASLVREAEVYILSQTGFSVASPEYETACAQLHDFHTQRGGIVCGGRDEDREAQRCTGNMETYEAGCCWSKLGQCAPRLQVIALCVMYMRTCSSPAERNWPIHEDVHTKKHNRLEFEKVAKLVEISANVRLLSHQRAGRGFALLWTLDESLLDVEGGIGTRPSWKGTDDSRTQQELESHIHSWQRDPCGSRAPPSEVAKVFGTRAATLSSCPRDDDNDYEGQEQEDERAGPTTATPAAQEADEWSDPEDVRRRIGKDALFGGGDFAGQGGVMGALLSDRESGCGGGVPGQRRAHVRSGVASSTDLPPVSDELHRGSPPNGGLRRLVKGPRRRLEERLAAGGDKEGLTGRDGGALEAGRCGTEVVAAVDGDPLRGVRDEGMSAGGGGGFSEFADLGMPPGESESRGDISVGMQAFLGQISALHSESFSPAMRGELMPSPPEAEGDEDPTPPRETSAERLDRLDSHRACLMARGDPRTQELARLLVEERQRQLGTFTPMPLDVKKVVHMDPPTGDRDGTQGEAATTEASRMGGDVEQGSHETGFAPPDDPRLAPNQPPRDEQRPEDTLHEAAGMPLPTDGGQSVGTHDVRPSAQPEGIAPTTGGKENVVGDVDVRGVEASVQADPVSTFRGGHRAKVNSEIIPREEVIDWHDGDRQEAPQILVVRTVVGPVVPHQASFPVDLGPRAHGRVPVVERRVGRGMCAPPVSPSAPSRERPQLRYVATPRGTLAFGCMIVEELEVHDGTDYTEIDTRIFMGSAPEGRLPHVQDFSWGPARPSLPSGAFIAAPSHGRAGPLSPPSVVAEQRGSLTPRSVAHRRRDTTDHARESRDTMLFSRIDQPWSETRRVTTSSTGRQPVLKGGSTSGSCRDVVASGFGGRGGDSGGMSGRREGTTGAAAGAANPSSTYCLREASIILEEPEVVTWVKQVQNVPIDRRQEGETLGADCLPMHRDSHRHDDLTAAGTGTSRVRKVIMDDNPDDPPEPFTTGRGEQRYRGRPRGTGRSHERALHRSRRDSQADDDR
ncbi:hypothetical protein CBR_g34126 [Chara braunii]|uniref:Uncharacterized protein n=1 Tax=Chara braunii TaxID=69332 RepID=A0A388LI78_CHABU|nr:hypothetical protein CBR_g34126 [Chara braunii]|eukprot:GBG81943.1 hypothetical protein CBR_g34126 [Chara braunii]